MTSNRDKQRKAENGDKYLTWRDVPALMATHDARLQRLEYGLVALLALTGSEALSAWGVLPVPPSDAVVRLVSLFI